MRNGFSGLDRGRRLKRAFVQGIFFGFPGSTPRLGKPGWHLKRSQSRFQGWNRMSKYRTEQVNPVSIPVRPWTEMSFEAVLRRVA